MNPAGFPHSDILGSSLGCQLLEAYRRLLRPSSAPGAKASTVCPYQLNHRHSIKMLRVHYAVLKPRAGNQAHTQPHTHTSRQSNRRPDPESNQHIHAPVPSGPNSVPDHPSAHTSFPSHPQAGVLTNTEHRNSHSRRSTHEQPPQDTRPGSGPEPRNPQRAPKPDAP